MRETLINRKEKIRFLVISLTFILSFAFCVFGIKKDRECPNVPIFFEHHEHIWQYEPRTETTKKIIEGIHPAISPDRARLSYTIGKRKIMIYDVRTGESHTLFDGMSSRSSGWLAGCLCYTDWSPDGKYLLVDAGTGTQRLKMVIDSRTGQELTSFGTLLDGAWIENDKIVYTDVQERADQPRWEHDLGIAIIDINGNKRILKKGTVEKEYRFFDLLEDGRIEFELLTDNSLSHEIWFRTTLRKWMGKVISLDGCAGYDISYWTMDKFGNNVTREYIINSLNWKIKKSLPLPYAQYEDMSVWGAKRLTQKSDWVLFELNKNHGSIDEDEILVMNLKDPGSIKKIANGSSPNW